MRGFVALACLGGLVLAACGASRRAAALPQPLRPLRPDTLQENGDEREADLVHLALDISLDTDAQEVSGRATHRLKACRVGTREVRFHAEGLVVNSVEDGEGRRLPFEYTSPLIQVSLPEAPAVGDEFTIVIDYLASPERGLFFREVPGPDGPVPQVFTLGQFENTRCWIPTWDFPNERASFEGRYRVGGGLEVLSNGELLGVEDHGNGGRTFHWSLDQDLPTYLIALAVGKFEHYEDRAGEVPLEYIVAEGTGEEAARRAFGETPRMLAFFERLLGRPYPFSRYAQLAVTDYPWSGMENTTLSFFDDFLIGDEATIADLEGDPRFLVAHELAHHWFGNLVTCFGWSHLWLNEGWASYLELLYQEEVEGSASFRLWLERYRHGYLASGERSRHPLSLDWFTQSPDLQRANHVYTKGPWVLFMLHCAVGNDAFWRGTRTYLDRHAFGLATTEDFTRAFFDTSGHNLEGWIEQWVEAGGHPVFDVQYSERMADEWDKAVGGDENAPEPTDAVLLRVRQVQVTDAFVPLFDLPVAVDLHYADGRAERFRIQVVGEEEVFRLPLEGELVDLVFEAECSLLCEVQLEKSVDAWILQLERDDPPAQWRALEGLEPFLRRSKVARAALDDLLLTSPHTLLRQRSVALAGHADHVEALVQAATLDASPHVRERAAVALLDHRLSSAHRDTLGQHLEVERSPKTRTAVRALLGLETR